MRGISLKKVLGFAAMAAVSTALAAPAKASLSISLQRTGSTGPVNAGDTLTLNVVATVTGSDGTSNEWLQSVFGSIMSTPGANGPVGDFSTFTAAAPFNGTVQIGTVQDLNGLPGLDVGSIDKASSSAYIQARASSMTQGAAASGDVQTFTVGSVTFHVNSAGSGGSTSLVWVPRTGTNDVASNVAALWREDGVDNTANKNPTNSSYSGVPLTITSTPEPGSLALLGLGGLGLLLRRRRAM